jgi:oxygen-dependent protoporphyrinogen oxidase
MQRKRIAILGAGISGLATAWYLRQSHLPLDIILLEKSSRCGGWLHTDYTTGFHFEKGPRTFKVDKCPSTMRLIAELGLQQEVIWSEARPHHRYLWHNEELRCFPTNPLSFLLSPLTKGFIRALLTEWKQPVKKMDETVWEFVLRRFNYDVARLFFDPMVVGIFGGDIRKISVRACFPLLKRWEEEYGSVTKGFFAHQRQKRKGPKTSSDIPGMPLSAMFSFKGGMEQLSQTLLNRVDVQLHCQQDVKSLTMEASGVVIHTAKEDLSVDAVFCALPVKETGFLLQPHFPDFAKELLKVPSQSLAIVNLGYDERVLPFEGFGYLTSTYSNEDILGVVFDSSVFPEHNRTAQETRLTIKIEDLGQDEDRCVDAALKGIRRHLGISRTPSAVNFKRASLAIPQYGVGHLDKMSEFSSQMEQKFPQCRLVGNYLQGVSVDSCIARAKETVERFLKTAF